MHTQNTTQDLDIESIKIEDKEKYIAEKQTLLHTYKALAEEIEYAMDDIEHGLIIAKREKLALKIKEISNNLREIETMENLA